MRAEEFDEAYSGGLRKWFKQKWVNIGKKKKGDLVSGESGRGPDVNNRPAKSRLQEAGHEIHNGRIGLRLAADLASKHLGGRIIEMCGEK